MASFRIIVAGLLIVLGLSTGLQASEGAAEREQAQRSMVNDTAVTILGGSLTGTYSRLVADMAAAFNDGYDFRIVPMIGQGSIKGVEDLLYLEGVDIALLQSDVLNFFSNRNIYPDLRSSLRYITVLYNEEVHIVADKSIENVDDLAGRRVSFGPASSGTFLTSSVIFNMLGIEPEVLELSNNEGLERLKRGEIDAMVRVVGAPTRLLQDVTNEDGLHILALPSLNGPYFPANLSHDQYPHLIPEGGSVETVAVGALMAAYNWPEAHPKRGKIQSVVDRLSERMTELQASPYHTKWRDMRLERELPGWIRWSPLSDPQS